MAWEGAEVAEKGLERGTPDLFRGASGVDGHRVDAPYRPRYVRNACLACHCGRKLAASRDRPEGSMSGTCQTVAEGAAKQSAEAH